MADPSEVSICNRALARLGEGPITSIEAPTTDVGEQCSLIYADTLLELLVAHPWTFAVARQALVAIAEPPGPPVYGFTHAFALPTDPLCLRALDTSLDVTWGSTPPWPSPPTGLWRVEAFGADTALFADDAAVSLRYIASITDPVKFSPWFRRALVAELTAQLSYSITEKADLADGLEKKARGVLGWAKSVDASVGRTGSGQARTLIDVRYL
jgi:hypothetical protein